MGTKKQYGVIPYTTGKNGKPYKKILLITSRTNGFWIFPKGNLMKNKTVYETAAQEAYEEAGIRGTVDQEHAYKSKYSHNGHKHELILFPMKIDDILDEWPEKHQRKRQLVTVDKALQMINLDTLYSCLKNWQKDTVLK